jgi:hypothetical protein
MTLSFTKQELVQLQVLFSRIDVNKLTGEFPEFMDDNVDRTLPDEKIEKFLRAQNDFNAYLDMLIRFKRAGINISNNQWKVIDKVV